MAECVPQGMAMVGNRRVMMGLELKGFVPVAFATLLEAQIWETGMATDLRGPTPFLLSLAATLAVGSVCSPVGQAGAARALQGAVPWRGGPDPAVLQLSSALVVQHEPKWLSLCL